MLSFFLNLSFLNQSILVYFVIINFLTFAYFGFDKLKAKMHHHRIREITLWILCLIGGSAGGLLAMHLFRHKTQKQSFQAVLAVILAIQIWLIYYLIT